MNDDDLFLSLAQIKELTGAGTRETVLANLRQNGIRHTVKANGWPAVTFAAVLGTVYEPRGAAGKKPAKWSPNKAA